MNRPASHLSVFSGRLEERTDFPVDVYDGREFYHTGRSIWYRYRASGINKWYGIAFVTTTSTSTTTTSTSTSTTTTSTSTTTTSTSSSTTTTSTSTTTTQSTSTSTSTSTSL